MELNVNIVEVKNDLKRMSDQLSQLANALDAEFREKYPFLQMGIAVEKIIVDDTTPAYNYAILTAHISQ